MENYFSLNVLVLLYRSFEENGSGISSMELTDQSCILSCDLLKYHFTYAGRQQWTSDFWCRCNEHRIEWVPSVRTSPKWAHRTWKTGSEKQWRIRNWWGTLLSMPNTSFFMFVEFICHRRDNFSPSLCWTGDILTSSSLELSVFPWD